MSLCILIAVYHLRCIVTRKCEKVFVKLKYTKILNKSKKNFSKKKLYFKLLWWILELAALKLTNNSDSAQ
jgi:hypothetical protein